MCSASSTEAATQPKSIRHTYTDRHLAYGRRSQHGSPCMQTEYTEVTPGTDQKRFNGVDEHP